MNKDLSMFKFFKGEAENPYDNEKQNTQHQFWGYEQLFEEKFNEGDFSALKWIPPYAEDSKQWQKVLSAKPVEKDELFNLWLFNLLMVHLPEKYQSAGDGFLRMYYDTKL